MTGVKTAIPAKLGSDTVLSKISPPTLQGESREVSAGVTQGERLLWGQGQPHLLMAMAMMTGSQPEYSTSRVAEFLLAMMIQMGSREMKKVHTKGFT